MAKIKFRKVILIPYAATDVHHNIPGGEASCIYEQMFTDALAIQLVGHRLVGKLFVKDDIGLYILGEGKTNGAMHTSILLANPDYDFSEAEFILFGCCGSSMGIGIPGDVYLISATADMDLAYYADSRDLMGLSPYSWFANKSLGSYTNYKFNKDNVDCMWDLFKDTELETTQRTIDTLKKSFKNQAWSNRKPKIMKASSITSDNYWKGFYKHKEAMHIIDQYGFEDPYVATDMEDCAIARVLSKFGYLDKMYVIRYSVNMDVFMNGESPEVMWGEGNGSFKEEGFDNFEGLFPVATECATKLLVKLLEK